jgi:hypothetical protein
MYVFNFAMHFDIHFLISSSQQNLARKAMQILILFKIENSEAQREQDSGLVTGNEKVLSIGLLTSFSMSLLYT